MVAFRSEVARLSGAVEGTQRAIRELENEIRHIRKAITRVQSPSEDLMTDVMSIEDDLEEIKRKLNGDAIATRLDIDTPPSVAGRVGMTAYEQGNSRSEPTGTHKRNIAIAKEEFEPLHDRVKSLIDEDMPALREKLRQAGAPYTPGTLPKLTDY